MWIFAKKGFVSAVAHNAKPGTLLVRARFREDAEALAADLATQGCNAEVLHTPSADYAYRLECPQPAYAAVLAGWANAIDYPNFKNAVHGNPTRDHAYMACWSAMNHAQHTTRN